MAVEGGHYYNAAIGISGEWTLEVSPKAGTYNGFRILDDEEQIDIESWNPSKPTQASVYASFPITGTGAVDITITTNFGDPSQIVDLSVGSWGFSRWLNDPYYHPVEDDDPDIVAPGYVRVFPAYNSNEDGNPAEMSEIDYDYTATAKIQLKPLRGYTEISGQGLIDVATKVKAWDLGDAAEPLEKTVNGNWIVVIVDLVYCPSCKMGVLEDDEHADGTCSGCGKVKYSCLASNYHSQVTCGTTTIVETYRDPVTENNPVPDMWAIEFTYEGCGQTYWLCKGEDHEIITGECGYHDHKKCTPGDCAPIQASCSETANGDTCSVTGFYLCDEHMHKYQCGYNSSFKTPGCGVDYDEFTEDLHEIVFCDYCNNYYKKCHTSCGSSSSGHSFSQD